MTRQVVVGSGAVDPATTDVVLDLGEHHPSTHGALRLALQLDGDVVVAAEPLVGAVHRGAEKLFEVRDYRSALVLANRHDWLAAFGNELGIVLAVEQMMGVTVPDRAVWLRTLLAELNRVLSALLFLGAAPLGPVHRGAVAAREAVLTVMEEASGGRLHYMLNRVGGLREDVPAGWTGRCRAAVDAVRPVVPELAARLAEAPGLHGTGVLPVEAALSYGVTGVVGRASGLDVDLRRDDPYLAYGVLGVGARFPVVLGGAGDSAARFGCLLEQVPVSLDLVDACLDALPGGEVGVRMPKTVRAPEGATYRWTENPVGVMGYYLVSRGERTPYRLAMRTASYATVSALPALLPGVRLPHLVAVLSSLFYVLGDVDK